MWAVAVYYTSEKTIHLTCSKFCVKTYHYCRAYSLIFVFCAATPCTYIVLIDSFDNFQCKHAYIVSVMMTSAGSKQHMLTNKFMITANSIKQKPSAPPEELA